MAGAGNLLVVLIVKLFIFHFCSGSFGEVNWALDPFLSEELTGVEQSIVKKLDGGDGWVEAECRGVASRYLRGAGEVIGKETPVGRFKLITRVVGGLMGECEGMREVIGGVFRERGWTEDLPGERDLVDAVKGVLRVQYIYGWEEMREETGGRLEVDEMVMLAEKAMEYYKAEVMCYQWLREVEVKGKKDVRGKVEELWRKLGGREKAIERLEGKIQETVNHIEGLQEWNKYEGCRGISSMPLKYARFLSCYLDRFWRPYFYLQPAKLEVLSFVPVVLQVYDFVGETETNYMIHEAKKNLSSATVDNGGTRASQRTSMSSSLSKEIENGEVLTRLNRRIEMFTDLEVRKRMASNLEINFYGAFGHYVFHHDSGDMEFGEMGSRLATFLIYLNSVEKGGYTVFPKLGIFARPVKGSAVFWHNQLLNGKPDKKTLHGGCPVLSGSKIVANKWIYSKENMLRWPCARYRFA